MLYFNENLHSRNDYFTNRSLIRKMVFTPTTGGEGGNEAGSEYRCYSKHEYHRACYEHDTLLNVSRPRVLAEYKSFLYSLLAEFLYSLGIVEASSFARFRWVLRVFGI